MAFEKIKSFFSKEEKQIPSNLDLEGTKQERIEITVDSSISRPSNFVKKQPIKGDHIRVERSFLGVKKYTHHGIYVSDNVVYHLDGEKAIWKWKNAKPSCTTLAKFLNGGAVEVREYTPEQQTKKQDVSTIIDNAEKLYNNRDKIKGYHLLWNNCECFANSCVYFKDLEESIKKINLSKQAQDGMIAMGVVSVLAIGGVIFKVLGNKNNKG